MYTVYRPEELKEFETLIAKELKVLEETEEDAKAYDNPAWAYKQAYKNGYRKGLKTVLQIIALRLKELEKDKTSA
jgi:hypothetical protein